MPKWTDTTAAILRKKAIARLLAIAEINTGRGEFIPALDAKDGQ